MINTCVPSINDSSMFSNMNCCSNQCRVHHGLDHEFMIYVWPLDVNDVNQYLKVTIQTYKIRILVMRWCVYDRHFYLR